MIENVLTTYTCDFCASTYNDVVDLKSHNEAYPMGECTAQSVENDEALDLAEEYHDPLALVNTQLQLKGPWSYEEDQLLLKFVAEYGAKKWTFIGTI